MRKHNQLRSIDYTCRIETNSRTIRFFFEAAFYIPDQSLDGTVKDRKMAADKTTDRIMGYHAHVYFDALTVEKAKTLCQQASDLFAVSLGRVHERPVGPHPMYSCQLGCTPAQFAELLPWLILNRDELIVFCHPETGDHLADHTRHVIWLGEAQTLDVSIFHD